MVLAVNEAIDFPRLLEPFFTLIEKPSCGLRQKLGCEG